MKFFTKKSMVLKIIVAIVVVILFNFSAPTLSQASIGGTLLSPLVDLLIAIGDGAVYLIQSLLFGMNESVLRVATVSNDIFDTVTGILVPVLAIAAGILVPGIGAGIVAGIATLAAGTYAAHVIEDAWLPEEFYLPVYAISPEEIFKNRIGLLDVNFFDPNEYDEISTVTGSVGSQQISSALQLQASISSWYLTLRNFSLVVLLSVLLYIGIRIITSSAAQDKAKYKERLVSWIVAMCLLFFMHYIMAFATMVVEAISEGITDLNAPMRLDLPSLDDYYVEYKQQETDADGNPVEGGEYETVQTDAPDFFETNKLITEDGAYVWPTNLMGNVRVDMQMEPDYLSDDNILLRKMGYTILFLMLVFYTVAFLVVYLKRLVMLAFLTMIAPLVAMTYPLDKMSDGNAQAFNSWVKEYVFNLLIQPLHLILYTMLIGSAISIAAQGTVDESGVAQDTSINMIYAIVALGFIFQAEKIMRRFFGFDKASTLDTNGSAVGGALAMAGINQLRRIAGGGAKKGAKGGGGAGGGSGAGSGAAASARKIKTRDIMNQITGRNRNGQGAGSGAGAGAGAAAQQRQIAEQRQRNASGRSDEGDRIASERQALSDMRDQFGDGESNADTYAQMERDIRESDTRGIGTWARDAYQGSRLQSRVQRGSNAVRSGLHTAADYWNRTGIPGAARTATRKLGNGARAARDLAANTGNKIRTAIPKPIRNSARTLGGHMVQGAKAAGNVAKGVGAVGLHGLKYAAPRVGKAAVKGAAAFTGATLGAAAGLATGDMSNALKIGAAGGGVGWALGSGAIGGSESLANGIDAGIESIRSTYTTATQGVEAEEARKRAAEDKLAMKDADRRKLYSDKLGISGRAQIKEVMQDAQKYREQGITDDDIIIKAMQTEGFGDGRSSNERLLLAALASESGGDDKKLKEQEERLGKNGLDQAEVKRYMDKVREMTGRM